MLGDNPWNQLIPIFHFLGIAPGRGTNRNEALHRWLNTLFSASKISVPLAYALLMMSFDLINNKEDSDKDIAEKEIVSITRRRLTDKGNINMSSSLEIDAMKDVFGIGVHLTNLAESEDVTDQPIAQFDSIKQTFGDGLHFATQGESEDNSEQPLLELDHDKCVQILTKAKNILTAFTQLEKISNTARLFGRQFLFMSTAINLFYNEQFGGCDKHFEEHDKKLENILSSWCMRRERVTPDGNCFFRAVARNLLRMREDGELTEEAIGHLDEIGIGPDIDCENEVTTKLRYLIVEEWQGCRKSEYQRFLTKDNFDIETEKFKVSGYFSGELGNLMILAMSNLLKFPIVVFSSLENYPLVPVFPENQLSNVRPLYMSYNSAGCGHYDFVLKTEEVKDVEMHELKRKERESVVSCSCGVNRKGEIAKNVCNNSPGSYGSRCKCFRSNVECNDMCRCKGCCNPHGERKSKDKTNTCSPRKRQRFNYQKTKILKSDEFLENKNEKPRQSSMTQAEYFVLEEVIGHLLKTHQQTDPSHILKAYNHIQSLCTAKDDMKCLALRKKELKDIKKAVAARDHEVTTMTAIFKKQVELCYKKD